MNEFQSGRFPGGLHGAGGSSPPSIEQQLDFAKAELAALREELLKLEEEYDTLEHANITLNLKLADAERRGEAANDLLMRSKEWMAAADCHVLQVAIDEFSGVIGDSAERLQVTFPTLMDDIRAALKPTESGASE